ncbi:porin [Mesosutterella sp. OilRF-GAM-744-9]|uniref:Porin n=1 Tax=Mesosutterella porci TaxID=2915351 RepID=A0ABS9MPR6_9BURK|nr:porin [Mesosutterella sp. oilRF-744-WT-GAM-9]MCG5030590.1 porin [Mesosutterella sp. oilRF-744-WT-GAM-9]
MTHLARAMAAAAAAAAISAAAQAGAAEVKVYGRIDTGLIYNHYAGDSLKQDAVTLDSGVNTASRWGLKGSESLTDSTRVLFQMENRFTSDSGAFKSFSAGKSGRMFGGQMFLGVANKQLGEIALGRMAGTSSGSGAFDLQYYMDAFGGGTNGAGNAPVKAGRYDNAIAYRSPMLAGFQTTLQYSMKNDGYDEGDENTSDVNRYWSAALRYSSGPLNLVGIAEGVAWGRRQQIDSGASTSKKLFTLGGSYRFQPATVYAEAQYYNGANAVDSFSAKRVAEVRDAATGAVKTAGRAAGSIEGYGLYAGAQVWLSGLSSWQSMAYWKDYTLDREGVKTSGHSIGVATKYIYRPSKTVELYLGGGMSEVSRIDGKTGARLADKNLNVFSGLTKYF